MVAGRYKVRKDINCPYNRYLTEDEPYFSAGNLFRWYKVAGTGQFSER